MNGGEGNSMNFKVLASVGVSPNSVTGRAVDTSWVSQVHNKNSSSFSGFD